MNLAGKTALVSGGNGGIGSAIVAALHEKGANVYSLDLDGDVHEAVPNVHYLSADITDTNQLTAALEQVEEKVDILILSTGIMRRGTVFDSTEEEYDLLFNSNVKSAWMLLKHVKPLLVDTALVAQVSSAHALYTVVDPGLYTLTKKTTAALAEILALTCPEYDVRVIYPGPVLTKLLLTGRSEADQERISKIATPPAEFAEKVIQLLESDHKSLKFIDEDSTYRIE